MKSRRLGRICVVSLALLMPLVALAPRAGAAEDLDVQTDARYEGFGDKLALEDSNTALTWFGFAFCSVVALLGMFKDAKRTHLD